MVFMAFANAGFRYFEALHGPLGPILAPLGPKINPKMGPQIAANLARNHLKESLRKLKTIKNVKKSLNLGLGFKMVPRWFKMAPSSTR